MAKLSKSQKAKIDRALAQDDKWSKGSHLVPSGWAGERRREEGKNTWNVTFKFGGVQYAYASVLSVESRNYYYGGRFMVDGKTKTRREFEESIEKKSL